jgi:steroid delta-isomerase
MDPVARVCEFYEQLSPQRLATIGDIYAPGAYFKDPFNEVHGVAAIESVFAHMFTQVRDPRFVVIDVVRGQAQAFLTWEFHFYVQRLAGEQTIRGASHLRFEPDGKVGFHRDYWDAAEELYAKLPVLGALMRWLRRRAATPSTGAP